MAAAATAVAAVAVSADVHVTSHQLTRLESGVRVVTEAMPSVRSVALGFWVGAGSRYEQDDQAGLSHLIEHLVFRGTAKFGSVEIDQIFDEMGAELNAATGREATSYYARMLDRHLDRGFEVLNDMVWQPTFAFLDAEREVVLEEITMTDDDPHEAVFEHLGEVMYGDHPLGRPVIGRSEVIGSVAVDGIVDLHRDRYVPSNLVIAASGSIDHDHLVDLVEQSLPPAVGQHPDPIGEAPIANSGVRFTKKDVEQFHICIGLPGISRHDERRYALRLLVVSLGGASSSRLFQEIRENLGLAYSVYSFTSSYADSGQFGVYLATRGENVAQALKIVRVELNRIASEDVDEAELRRAQENTKGQIGLSLESSGARMNRLGSAVLADMPVMNIDDAITRIDGVTAGDIAALANELVRPDQFVVTCVGPDEAVFREALPSLESELVG